MNKPPRTPALARFGACCLPIATVLSRARLALGGLVLVAAALIALPARAQQVTMVAEPVRVTVPINFSGATVLTNAITITTNGVTTTDANGNWVVGQINLSAAGAPSTPSGLSFTFTDTGGNVITSISPVITNTVPSLTTNVLLWVNTTNVAEGTYSFSANASGAATDTLLLTLQVAHIWSGATFTGGGTADFADAGNWVGGNVPGPGSDVVFGDSGALGSGITTTNVLISANTEIGSFRQAITQSATRRDNIQINDGVTLKITGTNGFSAGLRDDSRTSQAWELAFTGQNGTLMVSNATANLDLFSMYNQAGSFYLNGLGTFVADVDQLNISDYRAYPNYDNMQANNYSSSALPRQMPPGVNNFALTNIIQCSFTGDTNNWQDPAVRDYSLVIGRNLAAGTTTRKNTQLGITNYFGLNSICIAGFGVSMDQTGGRLQFNPGFAADNPIAVFRDPNGTGRVAMFAIGDGATPGSSGSSTKAIVDFTGGTVDALVDRLYLALDRTNASQGYTHSELYIGAGTFDVNDVIIGDQSNGNNLNPSPSKQENYCQGIVTVNKGGLLKVNGAMDLGYTTADATNNLGAASYGYGQLTVNAGSTATANVIRVGGVTKLTGNNTITINGGTLAVATTIAGPDKYLANLTVENGGTLTLSLNATNTTPYVYTTNLTTSGAATIEIADLSGFTFPAQVPLIQYAAGTPTLALKLPAGYNGAILNNGPGSTIDAYITAGAPKSLVWRGYVNSDWDTTTKNWLDLNTGLHTNFANVDDVSFDDAAGTPVNVNLAAANLIPGSVTMTNTTLNYTFSGSGTTVGSATLTKAGTGSLDIEANTTLSVQLTEGLLTGAGTINSAVVATNAIMNYSGSVSAGVTCAGMVINSGTINGLVDVQPGGILTNLNTINGPFTLESGSLMVNNTNATMTGVGPTATVNVGAFLLNNGTISDSGLPANGGTVQMYGTLEDTGAGSLTLNRLNILPGAWFIPGGDGIGTTTLSSDGFGTYPGRLSLNSGSFTLLKVDPGAAANTSVLPTSLDYGPSQKFVAQNGCTLVITNVGTTPFAAGQVFNCFGNSFGGDQVFDTGSSTNSYPVIQPASPGPGLSWDLSHLWPNGLIGVVTTPKVTMSNVVASGNSVVANFSWDSSMLGWSLEMQTNSLATGLSTNWIHVAGSSTVTSVNITNTLAPGSAFFRLVYP